MPSQWTHCLGGWATITLPWPPHARHPSSFTWPVPWQLAQEAGPRSVLDCVISHLSQRVFSKNILTLYSSLDEVIPYLEDRGKFNSMSAVNTDKGLIHVLDRLMQSFPHPLER